ncbi:hypothetical protein NC653_027467 [Populus alba x Populus x berolinensis]|uniref:Uncharacterized protein n=1 Tax=Populus alba x Populus x berolinensis TaxID=444605 RepID=A0AAD6M6G5_9ROSI|nr:hypothetical protein NC653_027467 [Populus alba x Populus x berolinensis]
MPEKRDCHLSSELGDTPTKELERASLQASWDAKLGRHACCAMGVKEFTLNTRIHNVWILGLRVPRVLPTSICGTEGEFKRSYTYSQDGDLHESSRRPQIKIIQQTDYLRQQSSSDLKFLVIMQDVRIKPKE